MYIQANAENDGVTQKVINRVQNRNNAINARLPLPEGKSLIHFLLATIDYFLWINV